MKPGIDERNPAAPSAPKFLHAGDGVRLAYAFSEGRAPTVVFLCGYASNMSGTKARFLETHCRRRGKRYLRFDYRGHGASGGRFEDGGIGPWSEDALSVIETATDGPLLLVGSSMGAWIMLLAALRLKHRVAGLVGIASAPDFSENLIRPALTGEQLEQLAQDGVLGLPSRYADAPQVVTRAFLDEARDHLLLGGSIRLNCPVRLIHGLEDPDVPWQTSLQLARCLESDDVQLTLVKNGQHRLSKPDDLALIGEVLDTLLERIG